MAYKHKGKAAFKLIPETIPVFLLIPVFFSLSPKNIRYSILVLIYDLALYLSAMISYFSLDMTVNSPLNGLHFHQGVTVHCVAFIFYRPLICTARFSHVLSDGFIFEEFNPSIKVEESLCYGAGVFPSI